jgi:HD-GYP domain-containing protein (c-di-GMP phosphodiesterase class II)
VFDRTTLQADLADCRGRVVARRGLVVSATSIADAARHAPSLPRRPVGETSLARDLVAPLHDATHGHLFREARARSAVERALLAAALPEPLHDELAAMRADDRPALVHAAVTAAVAVRMVIAATKGARGLPELAAAALVHDLGMRHLPEALRGPRAGGLGPAEAAIVAVHPLLGAYHVATQLGTHPAVKAALYHHARCGQGYPVLREPTTRSSEAVAIASAYAALTQPRPWRSSQYDARGAADVLVAEARAGHADANTVKLLVHVLRGGEGDVRSVQLGHAREGHAPENNSYERLRAPERSPL